MYLSLELDKGHKQYGWHVSYLSSFWPRLGNNDPKWPPESELVVSWALLLSDPSSDWKEIDEYVDCEYSFEFTVGRFIPANPSRDGATNIRLRLSATCRPSQMEYWIVSRSILKYLVFYLTLFPISCCAVRWLVPTRMSNFCPRGEERNQLKLLASKLTCSGIQHSQPSAGCTHHDKQWRQLPRFSLLVDNVYH